MTMLMEPLFDELRRTFAPFGTAGVFLPAADVLVTDDAVTVHMDVPGLTADSLEVELNGDVLTIRGERPIPYGTNGDGASWQHVERRFGRFERTLRVPHGLDPDAVAASLDNGVLTVSIPKPEQLKPRRIEIGTGASSEQRELAGSTA